MARSSEPPRVAQVPEPVLVSTPLGEARVWLHEAVGPALCVLVMGHGAGRGSDTPDLLALASDLPRTGISVVRLDQPWVLAGRKVAGPPAQLDQAWLAAVASVRDLVPDELSLVVGGRSAGARVACRTAAELGAVAVVALAFPLHPPGRPERSRAEELLGSGLPTLVLQGERDAFGGAPEVTLSVAGARRATIHVVPIPFADHSFRVPVRAPVTTRQTLASLAGSVQGWLSGQLAENSV